MSDSTTHAGSLPSGTSYLIEVPEKWNGVLLLLARPVPVGRHEPPWQPGQPPINQLVRHGYAVAGSASTIFWPLELAFSDHPALLEEADRVLGAPRHTIACGLSIGGIMTAGLVQLCPERLSGALPMCGNLAGAVAIHNRELDIAFVVKTLLAPRSRLELVHIADSTANLALAQGILHEAQTAAAGRARLALAAAVGNIPGWHDPASPEPAPDDFEAHQRDQFALFEEVGFLVFFFARKQVEMQAGGNPSWNTDVDYRHLLLTSVNCAEVHALYGSAGLDLEEDLERLASETRIQADPGAVEYLERHIVLNGDLGGVPVLTLHTEGDGLVTPDNERAYGEVVDYAGQQELLRQLYVHRGGHCTFTLAEILTALNVLIERIETGTWANVDPDGLNDAAARLGPDCNTLVTGSQPAPPQYRQFEPRSFPRPYDIRHVSSK